MSAELKNERLNIAMMPKHKCNIIIDSCCDLPYETVESMGVEVLRFPFEMTDGTHIDDFGQSMTNEEFYKYMERGEQPKTAQIPITELHNTFERAAKSGEPTVYLGFTSGLSGTFDTVLNVLDEVKASYPDAEIYAVDTLLASIAEGFLVLEAIKQRNNGLSASELAEWAEEARWFVHGMFTVDSLDSLRRGGRIPPAAASLGAKLDIKPILTFDLSGHLTVNSLVRGRKKSIKAIAKYMNENILSSDNHLVVYGNSMSERDMSTLKGMLDCGDDVVVVDCKIGPVIGSHVGPGMVAAAFWGPDRRKQMSIGDKIARTVKGKSDE